VINFSIVMIGGTKYHWPVCSA